MYKYFCLEPRFLQDFYDLQDKKSCKSFKSCKNRGSDNHNNFLISFKALSASIGVRLFISSPISCSRICESTGSSN